MQELRSNSCQLVVRSLQGGFHVKPGLPLPPGRRRCFPQMRQTPNTYRIRSSVGTKNTGRRLEQLLVAPPATPTPTPQDSTPSDLDGPPWIMPAFRSGGSTCKPSHRAHPLRSPPRHRPCAAKPPLEPLSSTYVGLFTRFWGRTAARRKSSTGRDDHHRPSGQSRSYLATVHGC